VEQSPLHLLTKGFQNANCQALIGQEAFLQEKPGSLRIMFKVRINLYHLRKKYR